MWITILLTMAFMRAPAGQSECTYDERCGAGMCLMWENTRLVCEPKQYTVAEYTYEDIDTVEVVKGARVECPLVEGEPDKKACKLTGAVVKFKPNHTWHYAIKKRGE